MTKTMTEQTVTNKGRNGEYAEVNGLKLYHEISGTGSPLIILHGGVGASEVFEPVLPALAENRRVIAVHLQGHGRTKDIDRPLSFEMMADDIAELIEHLRLESADVLGYSFGGGVALQTIIRHPEMVRKLVLISTPFKRKGFFSEVLEGMGQMGPEAAITMKESPLTQLYPEADWPSLFTKLGNLLRQEYDWTKGVAAIKVPVMLMFADADSISTEHAMEFYRLLGGGQKDAGWGGSNRTMSQLAILPGVTHYNILSFPTMATIIGRFLDGNLPEEK
jgi:pimeloyl-ACP methyl ester carboxylesterase